MTKLQSIQAQYQSLDEGEKLLFLKYLWEQDKFKLEYTSMPSSLQKFYNAEGER